MHRPRYYRNPAIYHSRSDPNSVRFGYNGLSQMARNTYRGTSVTPFSPSHNRFVDRSKYVWTANKQQQPQQPPPPSAALKLSVPTSTPVPAKPTSIPAKPTSIPAKPTSVPAKPTPPPQSPIVKQNPPQQSVQIMTRHTLVKKSDPSRRDLPPLSVSLSDSPETVANDIAAKLNEEKVYLINKVVSVLGVKKAVRLYQETRLKEATGGILVQNGIRRRTPGGVFLTLLRESNFISPVEVDKIFQEIKRHELKLKLTHFRDS